MSLNILYSGGNQTLAQLLDFPIHASMGQGHDSPEEAAAKQARLTANAPAEETIADYAPPKIVDKRFTGRIRPEWKGNNGK